MNAKLAAGISHHSLEDELLNPFVHHLELETTYEKVKTAILTVILLPIRVSIICFFLISGWFLAVVGLWGVTEEDLRSRPLTGWRSTIRRISAHIIRWMFVAGGFHLRVIGKQSDRRTAPVVALAPHSSFMDSLAMVYMGGPSIVAKGETASIPFFGNDELFMKHLTKNCVLRLPYTYMQNTKIRGFSICKIEHSKLTTALCFVGQCTYRAGGMNLIIKGKQVSRKEAPILVAAPHSTFLDGGIIYATRFPSAILRRESGTNPYMGKLINFTQPVYVWRDDPDSRQNTIKEIISRATSDLDWPQILIFPEGTCTNRSCLITFKPGAFYPGVPIQPVCIRYPNKLDTVTWTWEGPSALKLLWLTLTQPYSSCEIEFLPVYTPNEEEKRDPKLFANNVRAVMAKALGVPVSDYTYSDCKLIMKAKEMNLPNSSSLVEVQKLRHRLSLDQTNIEENLVNSNIIASENLTDVSFMEFCKLLNLSTNDHTTQHLFRLYDKDLKGVINFREYLLGVLALSNNRTTLDAVKIACKIYDNSGAGRLTVKEFSQVLCHTLAINKDYAVEIFEQIDKNKLGYITFDNFLSYAEKKAEFAGLFSLSQEEKFTPRNGQICPSDFSNTKKID